MLNVFNCIANRKIANRHGHQMIGPTNFLPSILNFDFFFEKLYIDFPILEIINIIIYTTTKKKLSFFHPIENLYFIFYFFHCFISFY